MRRFLEAALLIGVTLVIAAAAVAWTVREPVERGVIRGAVPAVKAGLVGGGDSAGTVRNLDDLQRFSADDVLTDPEDLSADPKALGADVKGRLNELGGEIRELDQSYEIPAVRNPGGTASTGGSRSVQPKPKPTAPASADKP